MKRYRKPIVMTLLFLVAGTIINVAMAWGIAWSYYSEAADFYHSTDAAPLLWPRPAPKVHRDETPLNSAPWPEMPDWAFRQRIGLACLKGLDLSDSHYAFTYERYDVRLQSFTTCSHFIGIETWGWPLRGLERRHVSPTPQLEAADERLVRLRSSGRDAGWVAADLDLGLWYQNYVTETTVALPLRPRPLEFGANSVIFGSLLAGLTLGPFALRRWVRRRRGACVACGYSLQGNPTGVCSECGAMIG